MGHGRFVNIERLSERLFLIEKHTPNFLALLFPGMLLRLIEEQKVGRICSRIGIHSLDASPYFSCALAKEDSEDVARCNL